VLDTIISIAFSRENTEMMFILAPGVQDIRLRRCLQLGRCDERERMMQDERATVTVQRLCMGPVGRVETILH
jgi:hypothetical protein